MKVTFYISIISILIFTSCQHGNDGEAQNRHEEMKQIISSYDEKVNSRQAELEKKIIEQEKLIAELSKTVSENRKDLKDWNKAKNKEYVDAALSLSKIPNSNIKRSVITILGQLKGPAAEQGIIDIVLSDGDSSNTSSGLSALQSMGSTRLRELCLKVLEGGDPKNMQYALRYLTPIAKPEDLEKVIKIADSFSGASSDYNVRYCWNYIMKLFLEKGGKKTVPVVLKVLDDFNKDGFKNICWGAIIVAKYGTQEEFQKAAKIVKPFLSNENVYLDSDISYWLRDNSKVEMIPVMKLFLKKAKSSYRRYIYQGFVNIAHPSTAKMLVEEYTSTKDSSTKSMLIKAFQGGYPGTMWFEDKKEAKVIPEKELDELIKKFK